MTDPIAFGTTLIIDHNQNDLFDLGTDAVTDEKSQPLPSTVQQAKLAAILKKIDAPKWKGVSLSMAAKLFNGLSKAELMAQQGYVLGTETALLEAEAGADGTHLVLKADRKKALVQTSLKNGVAYRLREARQDAKAGESVGTVKMHLDFAQQYAARLRNEFRENLVLAPDELEGVVKAAYPACIRRLYSDIEKAVNKGDIEMHRLRFAELTHTLNDAQSEFGFQLSRGADAHQQLEKTLYRNGIPYHYGLAEQDAAEGDVFSATHRLKRVRHYIQYSNQHFQTSLSFDESRGRTILKIAYQKAVQAALQEALVAAKKGEVDEAEGKLFHARDLTEEFNREIAVPSKTAKLPHDAAFEKIVRECTMKQICPQ